MSASESFTNNGERDSFLSVYFASLAATGLWGILTMQVYLYYLKYPKDRLWIKFIAFWLWLISTTHQVLYIYGLSRLITSESNSGGRAHWDNQPEYLWQRILMAFASTTMQGFFIYRLYVFNGGRKICLVILIPSTFTQLACSIAYAVARLDRSQDDVYTKLGLASHVFALFVDLVTAVCMMYWLFIGRTGTARTDRMVLHLFTIAIASGFWTTGLALGTLVTMWTARNPFLKMALQIPLVSGYGNVVLANLNVRSYIRREGQANTPVDCSDSFDENKTQLSIQFRTHTLASTMVLNEGGTFKINKIRTEI